MKKCIALMLAVVMAVCMLAGCGGSKLTFATGGTTGTYYSCLLYTSSGGAWEAPAK